MGSARRAGRGGWPARACSGRRCRGRRRCPPRRRRGWSRTGRPPPSRRGRCRSPCGSASSARRYARADQELKPSGRSAEGCPVLGFWIGYFSGRPAAEVGAAVLRYAPKTAAATTAREAIAPMGAVQRKGRGGAAPGGGQAAGEVGGILGRLGEGRSLDSGVRSRREPLFGRDFSGVGVHDGSTAASLSAGLDARARSRSATTSRSARGSISGARSTGKRCWRMSLRT